MKTLLYLLPFFLVACCDKSEQPTDFQQPEAAEDQNSGDFIDRSEYDADEFQRPQQATTPKAPRVYRAQMLRTTTKQMITANYDVSKRAVINSAHIEPKLGGVLKGFGQYIVQRCREDGICPLFVTAVMQHESDNGTSRIARDYHNIAGIMNGRKPVLFDDVQSCIDFTINLLSNNSYAGKSRKTIAKIQARYCPIKADNDPQGINKHWLGGVQKWMERTFGAREVYCLSK